MSDRDTIIRLQSELAEANRKLAICYASAEEHAASFMEIGRLQNMFAVVERERDKWRALAHAEVMCEPKP